MLCRLEIPVATVAEAGRRARFFCRNAAPAQALPAEVLAAVDGTGAGDAFTACLLVSLLEGRPWAKALRRACGGGGLAASRPGAQPSLPTADEVDAILGA